MALPPLLVGAVKLTVTRPLPAVAVPMDGVPGTVEGVTLLDGADAAPVPVLLVAWTLSVYVVPLTRPLTVMAVQGALHVPATLPGVAVAV